MPLELDTDCGSSFFIKLPDVFPLLFVYIVAFCHLLKFRIFKDPSHTPPAPQEFQTGSPSPTHKHLPIKYVPSPALDIHACLA